LFTISLNLAESISFEQIEAEILSKEMPNIWEPIDLDQISYRLSTALKSAHYNLKDQDAIEAFVAEVKNHKKKVQLCVYQQKKQKYKKIKTGGSVFKDDEDEVYNFVVFIQNYYCIYVKDSFI